MASELLLIDPSSGAPDQIFECEMDPEDMGGISGLSLPLQATNAQKNALRAMLEKGDLISGKSKLVHGPNAAFDENGLLLPPGLDIAASVRKNPNNDRRNLAVVTGTKPILVVKVTDSVGKARSETPFEIGDNIFGYGTDQVNLKSQMAACSMNTLDIVPGSDPNGSQSATGVVEVTINVSLEGNSRSTIRNAVTTAVTNKIGESLPGRYQQVMYVLEGCYLDCGWAAYAYINSWNSVYQGNYYYMTGVQMHELGHNFNLAHSGGLDGATYTDHTGLMGNPLYSDEIGKMCFNAAKNWQIGWYNSNRLLVDPRSGPTTVNMVGIADFLNNPQDYPVVIKIETGTATDQFIAFNRAIGINSQNDEADNEVTIVETGNNGEGYSQSYLKAHLVQGETYIYSNWAGSGQSLVVNAKSINLASSPAVAQIEICLGSCATVAPTKSPTMAPRPPTSSPTAAPTMMPSKSPTMAPRPPTSSPTAAPTRSPTKAPTKSPVAATDSPTASPTTSAERVCKQIDWSKDCRKTSGCTWSQGLCVVSGNPAPSPTASPPTESPPTSGSVCSSFTKKNQYLSPCKWSKGLCM
jgi:hypothetical protein